MVIVDGVVIVVVVEHEPFHQLVEILLKVLLDRCSLPRRFLAPFQKSDGFPLENIR